MPDPTVQDGSLCLTREQAVLIASRLFAAYFLFWVVSDVIALPHQILTISHELRGPFSLGLSTLSAFNASYYARTFILDLLDNLLRIILWLMAAGWFYRCGPKIKSFFEATGNRDISGTDGPSSGAGAP
jgi:hypothetical protein